MLVLSLAAMGVGYGIGYLFDEGENVANMVGQGIGAFTAMAGLTLFYNGFFKILFQR